MNNYLCRTEFADGAELGTNAVFSRIIGQLVAVAFLLNSCSVDAGAPIIAAGQQFQCTPIAVWDGDGPIWCREGMKIRLAGIAAREIDGSCRPGSPCPMTSGTKARDQLASLFGGAKGSLKQGHVIVSAPAMQCLSAGSGKGDRTAAWCLLADGRNVSCEMITSGTVLRWKTYDLENVCDRKKAPLIDLKLSIFWKWFALFGRMWVQPKTRKKQNYGGSLTQLSSQRE